MLCFSHTNTEQLIFLEHALFIITGGIYFIGDTDTFSTGMALLGLAVATLPHCVFYGYGIYWLAKWLIQCTTTHGVEGVLCRMLHSVTSMAMEYTGWPSDSNSVPLLHMEFYIDC